MKLDSIASYEQSIIKQQKQIPLVNFWRNAEFYSGTFILKDEYPVLKQNNLLITEDEILTDSGLIRNYNTNLLLEI